MADISLLRELVRPGSALPDQLARRYATARPFPHLVMDNLFTAELLENALREFDLSALNDVNVFRDRMQAKQSTSMATALPPAVQRFFDIVHGAPFLRLVTRLTGITGLVPDPYLYGGGMHEVGGQGQFQVHLDFSHHPVTNLENRLALLTYLNAGWDHADGGGLELWHDAPRRRAVEIRPLFARTVLMEQSARAWHGHPQPVQPGRVRRALIAYFYTAPRPETRDRSKTTLYLPNSRQSVAQRLEAVLRRLAPPLIMDAARARRRARRKAQGGGQQA
ncbi:2OG-Fe(II) oxygenase [Komagataeibacter sp. FNDCF1]|uniref:2OG-Fe(II) oxygenase n=1 Tax=Komagataeibacter sp. FNDCF1 TaxID=2878681 RepID=UPI001E625820|nr:2OG-Fe(II) oxygenase [Komagataeibacter sp. FNDCF1]MCE2564907.1 2OG-Fe(II) oxygenase [Komagataeibacter sp. FNDCF1]